MFICILRKLISLSIREHNMSSSCCGGNCGCGSDCKCGNGCGGCKMYPDMSYAEVSAAAAETVVVGVAPRQTYNGWGVMETGSENGCNCGSNCICNPCNRK